jgi:PIN domain nuclease of toxin-antitoxin system
MFVTDTHPLIWYISKDYKKLSQPVRTLFEEAQEGKQAIYIPTAVLWEISLNIKTGGSIRLAASYESFLQRLFSISTFIEEPITQKIVNVSHNLNFSKDPFDTIIVATALSKDLKLISNDSVIHKSKPCDLFWDGD